MFQMLQMFQLYELFEMFEEFEELEDLPAASRVSMFQGCKLESQFMNIE